MNLESNHFDMLNKKGGISHEGPPTNQNLFLIMKCIISLCYILAKIIHFLKCQLKKTHESV